MSNLKSLGLNLTQEVVVNSVFLQEIEVPTPTRRNCGIGNEQRVVKILGKNIVSWLLTEKERM
jgi:hypothetical protein